MNKVFKNVYKGKKVLVTGHTGFKGSWLSVWLNELGADVVGFSLEEFPTDPCNFEVSHLKNILTDERGDIRNLERFQEVIDKHEPEIIFHLAAQPIILRSYDNPKETFDTNAGGTVNVLEAVRNSKSVKVLVSITTDKVYKNQEWVWGYRENDMLGDTDPYAASKAMAEHAIHSYRESFFKEESLGDKRAAVASTRAGNVVGGGDFADFRLMPDSAKALMKGVPIGIRNPESVRPWQLVLEPLSGYLWLAVKLLEDPSGGFDQGWNFGPVHSKGITASELAEEMIEVWGSGSWEKIGTQKAKKESNLLMLDWSAAQAHLGWEPVYDYKETVTEVAYWFKEYANQKQKSPNTIDMYKMCVSQIEKYTKKAKKMKLDWAKS